jgi:hypothetical protein
MKMRPEEILDDDHELVIERVCDRRGQGVPHRASGLGPLEPEVGALKAAARQRLVQAQCRAIPNRAGHDCRI